MARSSIIAAPRRQVENLVTYRPPAMTFWTGKLWNVDDHGQQVSKRNAIIAFAYMDLTLGIAT